MNRDLRDPQKLGDEMIDHMKNHSHTTMSQEWPWGHSLPLVPDYDHGESLSVFTMRQYRAELKRAAERGDRHAADTLKGIPNDEPSDL